jgi:hypothetical protein
MIFLEYLTIYFFEVKKILFNYIFFNKNYFFFQSSYNFINHFLK